MKLTKKTIDALRFPDRHKGTQVLFYDDTIKGLGVRITPRGKKSYFFEYRVAGKSRRMTLGTFPELNPDHAREIAIKRKVEIFDGKDPAFEKKAQMKKKRTFGDLFEFYYEKHVVSKRNKRGQYLVKGDFDRYLLPKMKRLELEKISRKTVIAVLDELKDRPRTHNICRSYLKTMFSLAVREDWIGQSPIVDIEVLGEKSREEWIKEGDLRKLTDEIERYPNLYIKAYFRLLMFTAARKSELQMMRWSQIDFAHQIWTIPETKNGSRHEIHLTAPALKILKEIPRVEGNDYVFVGKSAGTHFNDMGKPWQRLRKRVGLEKYTIHDIRRTMASYLAQDGIGPDRIGQILNHKNQSVTGIYARLHHNDKVKTFERLTEVLNEIGVTHA